MGNVSADDMHPAFVTAAKLQHWLSGEGDLGVADIWHPRLVDRIDPSSPQIERLRGWFRTGGLFDQPEHLDGRWARVRLVHDVGEVTEAKAGEALPAWTISLRWVEQLNGWRVVFVGQAMSVEALDALLDSA